MAYAAWSVVAAEQPTTSKWNILGTNDSSFNDGTGIGTNAIAALALATNAIKLALTTGTTTAGVTTVTDISSSSTAVTIPAGARAVLILAWCGVSSASVNTGPTLAINAAGSDIDSASIFMPTASTGNQIVAIASETPSAGSRTYKLRGSSNNSTSFTSPKMLILVI